MLFKIALSEWFRSLIPWGRYKKQNKDFFWITLSLVIMLTTAIIIFGARNGFIDKISDISLGYIENAGIPLWVNINPNLNQNQQYLLKTNQNIFFYFQQENIGFLPIEKTTNIQNNPWQDKNPVLVHSRLSDDPIWNIDSNIATEIHANPYQAIALMNKNNFTKNFNCQAYIDNLQKNALYTNITTKIDIQKDNLGCLSSGIIWLYIGNNKYGERYYPFKIYWVDKIPLMSSTGTSILIPQELINIFKKQSQNRSIGVFPIYNNDTYIEQLKILSNNDKNWQTFRQCLAQLNTSFENLQQDANKVNGFIHYDFDNPLPKLYFDNCLNHIDDKTIVQNKDSFKFKNSINFDYGKPQTTISCTGENCQLCNLNMDNECKNDKLTYKNYELNPVFNYGYRYIEKKSNLEKILIEISQQSFYSIHPNTYDSLINFIYIEKILNYLGSSTGTFLLIFVFLFIFIQIGMAINNRKHYYGIMLAGGIIWLDIYTILAIQIIACLLVAIFIAIPIIEIVKDYLINYSNFIKDNTDLFANMMISDKFSLILVTPVEYFTTFFGLLILINLVILLQIFILRLKLKGEPSQLF